MTYQFGVHMKGTGSPPVRTWLAALIGICGFIALGTAMWIWAVDHLGRDLDLERHGIHVSATVLADGDDPKHPSEQLSFPLPDGTTTTEWTSAVSSQQAPGSGLAVVYLSGQPATVESADYLRWWWVALIMPPFGSGFIVAGLLILWAFVRALRQGPASHDFAAR